MKTVTLINGIINTPIGRQVAKLRVFTKRLIKKMSPPVVTSGGNWGQLYTKDHPACLLACLRACLKLRVSRPFLVNGRTESLTWPTDVHQPKMVKVNSRRLNRVRYGIF